MDRNLCRLTVAGISWLTSDTDRDYVSKVSATLESGGELLRATPHRRVLRVAGRPPLIVKHFAPQGIPATLKSFIRPSPAAREWRALRKAVRLALPVPRPVALGWRRKGLLRESFLVTEAVDDSLAVSACLFGSRRLAVVPRREVVRAAALAIRRMHDAGILHKDLHLDNMIVVTGNASPAVYLIDFQRAAFYRSLNPRLRMLNLAMLNGGCTKAARTDRLRFLKFYFSGNVPSASGWRSLAARLDKMGKRHRRRIWRSRQRRCLAENRDFKRVRFGTFAGIVRRDQQEALAACWQEPASCFSQATIVISSRGRTQARLDSANRVHHITRYSGYGFLHAIKNFGASSPAQRAWITGNSCVMRGIAAALPMACLERRRWRLLPESYVISGSEKGDDLVTTWARCASDIPAKRRLIGDFARYMAHMHDREIAIHRFTGKEIIVSGQEKCFAFFLVDFSDVFIGPLSRRKRIEHFWEITETFGHGGVVSKTDRLRFLRAYNSVDLIGE
jgi:tRNA A-37 threonylcarbamoyl transferase component Bud32